MNFSFLIAAARYLVPLLMLAVLIRVAISLFSHRGEEEIWAWLCLPNGERLPVTHWETTIGRAKSCDVSVQYSTISRLHAILTRHDDGSWTISDAGSKGGISVNGKTVQSQQVRYGEMISLADVAFTLVPITPEQEAAQARYRIAPQGLKQGVTLLLLTALQVLLTACGIGVQPDYAARIASCFGALCAAQWALYGFYRAIKRRCFEPETAAFLLCSLCLSVLSSSAPDRLYKQTGAMLAGVVVFLLVGWCLRVERRAKIVRYIASVLGIALLLSAVLFGREINGARNWIYIGGLSIQPSELAKICFVFAGASSLERLVTKRNVTLFLAYTAAICACLAIVSDFGTALIFFTAFVVIAYLRSGNLTAIALGGVGAGFIGVVAARFLPYITRRASAWGHVWENPLTTGYQQTRAMMCMAAGGLFGLGIGQGWLHYVAAADTDLVFALLGEEYGLIVAVSAVLTVLLLALFVVRMSPRSRSALHTIGASAAVGMFLVQTMLNVLGTVDLLPLTGVTFPFLSAGGSAAIASWGLLAFVKSVDTRQNASFTIRLPKEVAQS